MIRLVAEDTSVRLDKRQVSRIKSWILEFLPADRCDVRQEPSVEIIISGRGGDGDMHPPLLQRVEAIAGCRFRVAASGG
jgi:hypothetical protein